MIYRIENIDPLGQGVAKLDGQVYFIPKTLPEEEVLAQIIKKSKGVHFCQLEKINKESDQRIKPLCPHFDQCSGCHFQHTDYANELNFKLETLKRSMRNIYHNEIIVKAAPDRFGYRSRIQLHYDLKQKKIGFFDQSRQITPIKNCLIADPIIQNYLTTSFLSQWHQLMPENAPTKGHVELIKQSEQIKLFWNQNYAGTGFEQVNQLMNEELIKQIKKIAEQITSKNRPLNYILDLFGGSGNLSNQLNYDQRLVVDGHSKLNRDFFKLDIYAYNALAKLQSQITTPIDLMLLDPPRSGLKELNQWLEALKPKHVIYVSCNHQSMLRDLSFNMSFCINLT